MQRILRFVFSYMLFLVWGSRFYGVWYGYIMLYFRRMHSWTGIVMWWGHLLIECVCHLHPKLLIPKGFPVNRMEKMVWVWTLVNQMIIRGWTLKVSVCDLNFVQMNSGNWLLKHMKSQTIAPHFCNLYHRQYGLRLFLKNRRLFYWKISWRKHLQNPWKSLFVQVVIVDRMLSSS